MGRRHLPNGALSGLVAGLLGLSLLTGPVHPAGAKATVRLHDPAERPIGTVRLAEKGGNVLVQAVVHSLSPGFHGFHVHAVGKCDPSTATPFTSAGGHFNPRGVGHGEHAGDLVPLLINSDGTGRLRFSTDRFTIAELLDDDGSALIVHAGRDNLANIPTRYHSHGADVTGPDPETLATGDAGGRVACGVIQAKSGWPGRDGS
ncbi:MAG: superoxide dismutase family protein [Actinomycetota bacterium]|nr:superoxide dismutase family protein [Actinomycetota bacterium]